jgi:hypothetical protein
MFVWVLRALSTLWVIWKILVTTAWFGGGGGSTYILNTVQLSVENVTCASTWQWSCSENMGTVHCLFEHCGPWSQRPKALCAHGDNKEQPCQSGYGVLLCMQLILFKKERINIKCRLQVNSTLTFTKIIIYFLFPLYFKMQLTSTLFDPIFHFCWLVEVLLLLVVAWCFPINSSQSGKMAS